MTHPKPKPTSIPKTKTKTKPRSKPKQQKGSGLDDDEVQLNAVFEDSTMQILSGIGNNGFYVSKKQYYFVDKKIYLHQSSDNSRSGPITLIGKILHPEYIADAVITQTDMLKE